MSYLGYGEKTRGWGAVCAALAVFVQGLLNCAQTRSVVLLGGVQWWGRPQKQSKKLDLHIRALPDHTRKALQTWAVVTKDR